MNAITKYQANDGSEWNTAADAEDVDRVAAMVEMINAPLGPIVDRGRRRIDPETWAFAKRQTVMLCRQLFPDERVFDYAPETIHPMSWAGRFISECRYKALRTLWWRFSCVNGEWEYEQPFYAAHPEEFRE